jgi:hypothetical protein
VALAMPRLLNSLKSFLRSLLSALRRLRARDQESTICLQTAVGTGAGVRASGIQLWVGDRRLRDKTMD